MIEVMHDLNDKQFPVRIIFNNTTQKLTIQAARELMTKLQDIQSQYT